MSFALKSMPPVDDLEVFFELNPNVRSWEVFVLHARYINRLLNSTINLDELIVDYIPGINTAVFLQTVDFFKQHHQRGFYQRLSLKAWSFVVFVEQLVNIPGLEKIELLDQLDYVLPMLPSLKELHIQLGLELSLSSTDMLAKNLPNLEKLYITFATTIEILPFIRQIPKLTELSLNGFYDCRLNLSSLNKDREKLLNARKLTIYTPENVYIRTISEMHGLGHTNWRWVTIRSFY